MSDITGDETVWVYVFAHKSKDGLTAPVKVGISRDVGKRLDGIQTACPYPIDIAYVFELPNRDIARDIERAFHNTQRKKRTSGEWFDFEPVQAIHLLCIALRTLLDHKLTDPAVIDAALELSGVYWAEKRFGLAIPGEATNGAHPIH